VVLWCHGFRADALAHAAELERCAALGFLAVGIDAVGHGARVDASLARRVAQSPDGALGVMLDLVEETVQELPALLSALALEYEIDRARVSMVGISMGAFLAYRAIGAGIPLRTVVALLGSPEWQRETSPDRTPDVFQNVSLLSITAEHDANVPPKAVQRLHAALRAEDTGNGVHPHHHYVIRGAGHLMNADEWQRAMRVTTQWLQRMA
jgi:dienelactone hydrolase